MTRQSQRMTSHLLWGAAAGAVGTVALNAATYGDMLLRGRPSSGVPAKAAGILTDKLGIDPLRSDNDDDAAANRRGGAGALLGYATGIGTGMAYAVVSDGGSSSHPLRNGVLPGVAAMTAGDAPIILTGASDPRTWSRADVLSDLIPHLAYGLAAVAVLDNRE